MPKPGPEVFSSVALAEQRNQWAHDMGLGELRFSEIKKRFDLLGKQTQIGLRRKDSPTQKDGGLLAIRTEIPVITPEVWAAVPIGSRAYVADVAGTNWNIMRAEKGADGSVTLNTASTKPYYDEKRHVTFEEFVGRIAYPIAGEIIENGEQEEPTDIGISFGFAHTNSLSPDGIDAHLINVGNDGSLVKEWRITDWDPKTQTNLTQAVKSKLEKLGVKVRTIVAINDTPAVALDGEAVQQATDQGLEIIPAGFVGGTGTNGAVDNNGLVNLEMGHGAWPADEVFERMKKNGWTKIEEPELEPETGMYLPLRLAAGIQLLHERDESFPLDTNLIEQLTSTDPDKDQALISKIALGDVETDAEIQELAKIVLKRAGQIYGIMLATIADTAPYRHKLEHHEPRAFLAEGGTLLKGYGVKEIAEETAAALDEPIKLFEAKGLKGVGALAMAYKQLTA